MALWSEVVDGTAVGPCSIIEVSGGTVEMTALWSDEEGVGITVEMSSDLVVKGKDVCRLYQAAQTLLDTVPPVDLAADARA